MTSALGPFDLLAPVASGAMGVVWKALHREEGVVVAVKVLTAASARDPEHAARFRDEVRAVAGLAHPGIVHLLDHGDVPDGVRDLRAGSPYLVMEHASGGTLSEPHNVPDSWVALLQVLHRLLDALAHAHGRGVIHRDLKPSNVLVATAQDARPGLLLSDFGIASIAGNRDPSAFAGTPTYMAPEQVRGEWRDFGPWTDLYALGGVAWRLACGSPVFGGLTGPAVAQAHLDRPPGRFLPRYPVPDAFETWSRRLLDKDPGDRFACAADAAYALRDLAGGVGDAAAAEVAADADAPTRLRTSSSTATVLRPPPVARTGVRSGPVRPWSASDQPPVPRSWRRPEVAPLPPRLLGAGLSLLELRVPPIVGREAERDALWGALRDVATTGRPRVVRVVGEEGSGRTRLLRWLAERAHETGAGEALFVQPASDDDGRAALGRAIARALAVQELGGDELQARVLDRLYADEARDPGTTGVTVRLTLGLARAIRTVLDPGVEPLSDDVRRRALADLLVRFAGRRPLVLLVDDAARTADTVALVRALHRRNAAVLAVLADRDDVPLPGAEPATPLVRLAPLAPHEVRLMLDRLLPLSGETVDALLRRSAGNPLFTLQLVAEWVSLGVLRPGRHGFEAADAASLDGPRHLSFLWRSRLWPLLAVRPPGARTWLERAAVLGGRFGVAEWHAACGDGEDAARDALAEALVGGGLLRRDARGYTFVHAALRETLLEDAERSGRLVVHHRACAAVLDRRDPRLGGHLLAAGLPDPALEALLRGLLDERARGRQGLPLVEQAERAIAALGLPEADPRRGRVAYARVLALDDQDFPVESAAAADRLLVEAERHGWAEIRWRVLRKRGWLAQLDRDFAQAERRFREALEVVRTLGARDAEGIVLGSLAGVLDDLERHEEAAVLRQAAREICREVGDQASLCTLDGTEGGWEVQRGRLDEAEALYRRALAGAEGLPGLDAKRSAWLNDLAEIERRRGRAREGVELLRQAIELGERWGGRSGIGHLNLALVELELLDYPAAAASAELALECFTTAGPVTHAGAAHVIAVACAAAAADWNGFDFHLREAGQLLHRFRLYAPDAAQPLEHAARLAAVAGQSGRSAAAWSVAAEVWEALGRTAEAVRARARSAAGSSA